MPYTKSKYSTKTDGELKTRVIMVLDEASEWVTPTIEWIKGQDMVLAPYSHQKLSRILNNLVDMGLVVKGKSKSLGRMVYRLSSKVE